MSDIERLRTSDLIDPGYHDSFGSWHATTTETRDRILAAMHSRNPSADRFDASHSTLAPAGEAVPLPGCAEVALHDGTTIAVQGSLPPDLPLGYHSVRYEDRQLPELLIVFPRQCFLPQDLATWGIAVQLYSVRSQASWGIGDCVDLRALCQWSARHGAGIVQVNPLGADAPTIPQTDSPYFPSSRRFLNPLYLRIEDIAQSARVDINDLAIRGRQLNAASRINRNEVFREKIAALERIWVSKKPGGEFAAYCHQRGESLVRFATFCELARRHGHDYRQWPAGYRRPDSPHVTAFQSANGDSLRFFQWLQWLCERQLADASKECGLLFDLPIGFAPGGFDAWQWQDCICPDIQIGAPPDAFNVDGQNWGVPPFHPIALRACGFAPVIETLRAAMNQAVGLRIDHVMGLFRQFWIPEGMAAAAGTYVQFPQDELLAVLAVESQRAKCWFAGEDLGTVPAGMRERLANLDILSHRLALFESVPPRDYPRNTLAAVTTHDLPTLAGLWTGADIAAVRTAGLNADVHANQRMRASIQQSAGVMESADVPTLIEHVYANLASAPSRVVLANLEDALQVTERPNMPGTTDQWPNWRIPLPELLEDLLANPLLVRIAESLHKVR
jgi:4-alpha-glucanotransferase